MASPMTQDELKKLTVMQLRLLCKEKHITGYSKIAKDAIIEKLLNWQNLQKPQLPTVEPRRTGNEHGGSGNSNLSALPLNNSEADLAFPSGPAIGKIHELLVTSTEVSSTLHILSRPELEVPCLAHTSQPQGGAALEPSLSTNSDTIRDTVKPQASNSKRPVVAASLKRPFHGDETLYAQKKAKADATIQPSSTWSTLSHRLEPTNTVPGHSSGNVVVQSKDNFGTGRKDSPIKAHGLVHISEQTTAKQSIPPSKPFKALITTKNVRAYAQVGRPLSSEGPNVLQSAPKNSAEGPLPYSDFLSENSLSLGPISLPPSVAQRKRVPNLAVVLSGISFEDLRCCVLVSRLFRYSAYLSAVHQLSRKFAGLRLERILQRYSSRMTNLWPYLRHREQEVETRKNMYQTSFLGRAMEGVFDISENLWTSPDHDKQAIIAIRFLMTKLFFIISVGSQDRGFKLEKSTILDAQEVVVNDIWKVTVRSSGSIHDIYVLEATCEVVGRPPSSQISIPRSMTDLRADWSAYIASRIDLLHHPDNSSQVLPDLLEHLQWTNHEEYYRGISKLWLSRIQGEGEEGQAKLRVARCYLFACVVGNSISGQWLSSNEMLQEFNGLQPRTTIPAREQKTQRLNLFLPAHHHIESIHFSTSGGHALHPAVAVVQTPAREYFILRDNGMQVGCEEDGIAPVWMKLLACTGTGCLLS